MIERINRNRDFPAPLRDFRAHHVPVHPLNVVRSNSSKVSHARYRSPDSARAIARANAAARDGTMASKRSYARTISSHGVAS